MTDKITAADVVGDDMDTLRAKLATGAAELARASDDLVGAAAEIERQRQRADAEANRAAEMEAQANREKARADAAEQSIDVYEQRIREIADDVCGIAPADAATVVLLDAIGRHATRERIERIAAERARDEVGIQLAAAQERLRLAMAVVDAAREVRRVECLATATDDDVFGSLRARMLSALAAIDAVPGDALGPRIDRALKASGIDASNVKGVE